LEEATAADWQRIDELEKEQKALKQSVKDLRESRGVYTELINDADDAMEVWDTLRNEVEDGKTVFAPTDASKKRKRSTERSLKSRKKAKTSRASSDDEDDFIDDSDDEDGNDLDPESNSDNESEKGDPLTIDAIEVELAQLKEDKKRARHEKSEIDAKIKKLNQELKTSEKAQAEIETAMVSFHDTGP
jgi:chromosome segregation ATPase